MIRAVVFDIGGVLERTTGPERWFWKWQQILGLSPDRFGGIASGIDPEHLMGIGRMNEAEYRQRWTVALGLSEAQVDEFMQDMWDWYCGELDEELMTYVKGLPCRRAILSNSGSGAREQEEQRYGFSAVFDPIVYSHEVGLLKPDRRIYQLTCDRMGIQPQEAVMVDNWDVAITGAADAGMQTVLHVNTADTIRAIDALLEG
ncbi:MAG TPA: HAD-IA family hydrolase [Mycobacteriales bacterium]|nr:HAD-IA family hydrolase [Mycobacteriales bacterium]